MSGKAIVVFAVLVALSICGAAMYSAVANFSPELGLPMPEQSTPVSVEIPSPEVLVAFGYLAAIVTVACIFIWLAKQPWGWIVFVSLIGIGVAVGSLYITSYMDEQDGGNAQIVNVVQPSGNDPSIDGQYADINKRNSETNLNNTEADNNTTTTNATAFQRIYGILLLGTFGLVSLIVYLKKHP